MRYLAGKYAFILQLALLLGACASQVPQAIRVAPADSPSLLQVHQQADNHLGRQVRWGGTIIETGNREDTTRLTVLGRPLNKSGDPKFTDESAGRFIVIMPEFLDPAVYAPDRQVTVTGTLLRTEAGKVGEFPYTYPVVQADAWYLWPAEIQQPYGYGDSRYYGPWYDPWYPYGYPYYHRH